MSILIVGGGGFIGAHVAHRLVGAGLDAIVADSWLNSHPDRLAAIPWRTLDLLADGAPARLTALMQENQVSAVVHLAGLKDVEASVSDPRGYERTNVGGTAVVLDSMRAAKVKKLIFSSTSAVYQSLGTGWVDESSVCKPANPYGASKLQAEQLIANASNEWGLSSIVLRYFNVAGSASAALADIHGKSVIPGFIRAALHGKPLTVNGTDFDTKDGSSVRDYVDVRDLASLHQELINNQPWHPSTLRTFNVGSGRPVSVFDLIHHLRDVLGLDLEVKPGPRRPGDVPQMVADSTLVRSTTQWRPEFTLRDTLAASHAAARTRVMELR